MDNIYTSNNSTESVEYKCVDYYAEYLGKIVAVSVPFRPKPIKGKLIALMPDIIELERLDGTITKIRRVAALSITEARPWKVE
jgi:hypothetical protein